MARSSSSSSSTTSSPPPSRRSLSELKGLFWIPTGFLLGVYLFIFFHVSSTMKLVNREYPHHTHFHITPKLSSSFNNITLLAANSSRKYVVQVDEPENIEISHVNVSEPPLVFTTHEREIIGSTKRNDNSDDNIKGSRRVDQEITEGITFIPTLILLYILLGVITRISCFFITQHYMLSINWTMNGKYIIAMIIKPNKFY